MKRLLPTLLLLFGSWSFIYAQEVPGASAEQPMAPQEAPKAKSGDSYYADPFSDMAELENQEEEEEEEAIERFYAYGRIFHVELYASPGGFYGPMSEIYHKPWLMGGSISYFLDWDLAFSFHVGIGKASMSFLNPDPTDYNLLPEFTGSAVMFNLGFGLKYYINFNDISRVIAYINPAIHVGAELTIISDSLDMDNIPPSINLNDPSHKMTAPGLFFGMSLEMPIFRKSIYIGGDFMYHLSFFPADNTKIPVGDPHFGALNYSGSYMTIGGKFIFNL